MFNEEQLKQIEREYIEFLKVEGSLRLKYILKKFATDEADEYAKHGFARRHGYLTHSLKKIFEINPPWSNKPLDAPACTDVTLLIQAFIINMFGCMDNLARIFIAERNLKDAIGKFHMTFFGKNKKELRKYFSENFRKYLQSRDNWHTLSVDYRDTLAHRIPLYVPPFGFESTEREAKYYELENEIIAAITSGDEQKHRDLIETQETLKKPNPIYRQSFTESNKAVPYHVQLIADWKTVDELGHNFLLELEGKF